MRDLEEMTLDEVVDAHRVLDALDRVEKRATAEAKRKAEERARVRRGGGL